MVETLTLAVAASPLYTKFRNKLLGKIQTEYSKNRDDLFLNLYNTWCYNPISTMTLCLLSRNYELAFHLVPRFTSIEIDTAKLI
jgi:vacuole morphology and inheritance protein 14